MLGTGHLQGFKWGDCCDGKFRLYHKKEYNAGVFHAFRMQDGQPVESIFEGLANAHGITHLYFGTQGYVQSVEPEVIAALLIRVADIFPGTDL